MADDVVRFTSEFRKCECAACGGEPHYHIDNHTVIPWDVFVKSFGGLGGVSISVDKFPPSGEQE